MEEESRAKKEFENFFTKTQCKECGAIIWVTNKIKRYDICPDCINHAEYYEEYLKKTGKDRL